MKLFSSSLMILSSRLEGFFTAVVVILAAEARSVRQLSRATDTSHIDYPSMKKFPRTNIQAYSTPIMLATRENVLYHRRKVS
jgi:hypothetical protein